MGERHWTSEQRELIDIDESTGLPRVRSVAVLADAGSGKTSVLVERVRRLTKFLKGQERILCVSFTEKSAADIQNRLLLDQNVEVYTLHGFCSRLLREFGTQALGLSPLWRVADERDSVVLLRRVFQRVFRRSPPLSEDFSAAQWFELCMRARGFEDPNSIECSDIEAKDFLSEVFTDYNLEKMKRHLCEYSDLELKVRELLLNREVLEKIRNRYRHLFVDEFQDTSKIQGEIVRNLSNPQGSLFVVGDQKQSIYRFRGANVSVFEKFIEDLGCVRKLTSNFRSHRAVIEVVNDVFSSIIEHYSPMIAERAPHNEWSSSLPRIVRVEAAKDESDAIDLVLKKFLEGGGRIQDAVLLLPRIKGNLELLDQLKEKGWSVILGAGGGTHHFPQLQSLAILWVWFCEPWRRDLAAQVAIDFHWLFDLSPDQVRAQLGDAIAKLSLVALESQDNQNADEILNFLQNKFELKSRLGIYWNQFRAYIWAHQFKGSSPQLIARELSGYLSSESDIPGLCIPPPPFEGAKALRVMTVHSSKGLEFPLVLLADLQGRKIQSRGPFLRKGQSLYIARRGPDGKLKKTESFEEAKKSELELEKEESVRLLYVAMTRAQESIVAVTSVAGSSRESTWQSWVESSSLFKMI